MPVTLSDEQINEVIQAAGNRGGAVANVLNRYRDAEQLDDTPDPDPEPTPDPITDDERDDDET